MSSSSVAKDLGAINTSVASEILHFVQNDSRWRGTCFVSEVLTYGQSEVCIESEVSPLAKCFHPPLVDFISPQANHDIDFFRHFSPI